MSGRETDTALWLHNKLGSTDDLWSGRSICSHLSRQRLQAIRHCFFSLQPYVKVKLMLAFLHIPKRNIEEWKMELEEILVLAINDTDQWVSTVGDILRSFPAQGTLNTSIDDICPFFHEIVGELKKLVRKSTEANMLPLECLYLSRGSLTSVAGQQLQPVKHFALKRKPKSAALRAEILQRSTEAQNYLKRSATSTSMPIKVRSFAKTFDDKTPMKGIPSRTPGSIGFRSPTSGSRFGGSGTPLGRSTPGGRREGGIKLLDINEVPVGGREAKRRKKQQEEEQQKKEKEAAAAAASTPDYAAGLMAPVTNLSGTGTPTTPGAQASYAPNLSNQPLGTPTSSLPGASSFSTQQARQNLQQQLQQQLGSGQSAVAQNTAPAQPQPTATQLGQAGATPGQPQQQQQPTKKGLSLTREQMVEAQEMFRTSNKVTRPEKALILGFMAGSRENPCPEQGDIVNIRLSENLDSIQQPDGLFLPMVVDTFFQMNYSTGEWKRVKKYRQPDD